MKLISTSILVLFLYLLVTGQNERAIQKFNLHVHVNEVYPSGDSNLGHYPILWYDSQDAKVLVGGFGLGVSYQSQLKNQFYLRSKLDIQRSRYYDQPTIFNDANGASLGAFFGVNTSYSIHVSALPSIAFGAKSRWSFALGAGARVVLSSISDYGESFINGEQTALKFKRRAQAPVIAYCASRIRFNIGKLEFSTGLDADFTNASRLSTQKEKFYIWQTGIAHKL